jgi:hypothetical protein
MRNDISLDAVLPDMEHGPQLSINKAYVYGQDGVTKTKKSRVDVMAKAVLKWCCR